MKLNRMIVFMTTCAVIVTGTLVVVLRCWEQEQVLFPRIQLPILPIVDYRNGDPRTLIAEIDQHGALSINGYELTLSQLHNISSGRLERYGEFPVSIVADRRAEFDDVWAVARTCRRVGLRRFGLVVSTEPNQTDITEFDFSVSTNRFALSTNCISIVIKPHELEINNRMVSEDELGDHLVRIGSFQRTCPIYITPSTGLAYSNVLAIVAACFREELTNITIQQTENAQQKPPLVL